MSLQRQLTSPHVQRTETRRPQQNWESARLCPVFVLLLTGNTFCFSTGDFDVREPGCSGF